MVGCLRKVQNWSITFIFDEYQRYAGTKVFHIYGGYCVIIANCRFYCEMFYVMDGIVVSNGVTVVDWSTLFVSFVWVRI